MNKMFILYSKQLGILFLLIFHVHPSYCQNHHLNIAKYSITDGLSNNHATCLLKDSQGFLWVGTQDGLNRFDGKHFQIFKHSVTDTNSISGNIIFSLSEDKEGNVWISSPQGICKYNLHSRKVSRLKMSLLNSENHSIKRHVFADSKNQIWFNNERGIVKFIPKNGRSYQYEFEKIKFTKEIFQFYEDKDKNIWAITLNGVFHFDEQKGLFINRNLQREKKNKDFIPRCILQGKNSKLYLGLWADGIADFRTHDASLSEKTINTTIWCLSESVEPNIILAAGTTDGVYKLNTETNGMQLFSLFNTETQQNEATIVHNIYKDEKGIVWMASDVGLLKQYPVTEPEYIIDFDKEGISINGDVPGEVFYDPLNSRTIWFNVWSFGIFKVELNSGKIEIFRENASSSNLKLPTKYINFLHSDSNGNIWAGLSRKGLYKYDRASNSFLDAYPQGQQSLFINSNTAAMESDRGDTLTILASERGFIEYVPKTGFYREYNCRTPVNGSVEMLYTFKLLNTKHRDVFIASRDRGMYFYDRKNEKFSCFDVDKRGTKFPSLYTRDMVSDSKGNIWVATLEGLIKINTEYIIEKVYTIADGLPSGVLTGIVLDENEKLILSSDIGLINFDPEKDQFSLNFQNLGYPSRIVSSLSKLKDGSIALGYQNRLYLFKGMQFKHTHSNHSLIVNSIKIVNKEIPFSSDHHYTVRPGENLISVHFSLLDFDSKLPVNYQFYLDGEKAEWIDMGNNPDFTFSNLGPGDYTLNVRARSKSSSSWVTIATPISFTVLPPFYLTWWFISLIVVLVISIFYSIYKIRINQIIQVESVRSRISRDLHDDIGSTLSSINILSRSAKKRLEENDEIKLFDSLEKISDRSQRMLDNMSDIIWSVKPENDSLEKIFAHMREYASTLLETKKINFNIDFPDESYGMKLKLDAKKNLFLIFKEGLNNLIKYSDCTYVNTCIRIQNKKLILTIEDDGKGFDPDHIKEKFGSGNGLINMSQRAEEMKARFHIRSKENVGTVIILEMDI